jgi:D-3-phosphoglycerate dehydrogenase
MRNFDMEFLGYSPSAKQEDATPLGVQIVDLLTLIRESDYLMINCPLTDKTYHMLGPVELAEMKPSAYLINLSRGAIIHEDALVKALQDGKIAGAGLDVYEHEPMTAGHRLAEMQQVILTPHSLALTHDLFNGMEVQHSEIFRSLLKGQIPPHVVNHEVLGSPRFQAKLKALFGRIGQS